MWIWIVLGILIVVGGGFGLYKAGALDTVIRKIPALEQRLYKEEEEPVEEEKVFKLQGKFYVLVADSDEKTVKTLEEYCTDTGIMLTSADNGVRTLEKGRKEKFNLILLTNDFLRMDGVQILNNLKGSKDNKNRDTAVYMLLSNPKWEKEDEYLEKGFAGAYVKPIGKMEFYTMVMKHAPKKMLPEDEEFIEEIKRMGEDEKCLSVLGISLPDALAANNDDISEVRHAAAMFVVESYDTLDAMEKSLDENDAMKYMECARKLRDICDKLNAKRLFDYFDDNVNLAKDDGLDIAKKNWKKLFKEWSFVVESLSGWVGREEIDAYVEFKNKKMP